MKREEVFRSSLEQQRVIRVKTRHPDGDNFDGIVTSIKPGILVLVEEVCFEFDGAIVLPKKSIRGYRDGKRERCFNEIIRSNGAMKKCRSPRWLASCQSLPEVMEQLCRRDVWPAVEVIFNKSRESALYLGPITKVSEKHFYQKCYDATGKWEKEYKLSYDEVFKVEIGSKYCKYFNRYVRERK